MEINKTDLQKIFAYVSDNPSSNARQIGKIIDGGKSRANHYLYGYLDILFIKRGLTPPTWQVVSSDAYEKMLQRLNPQPIQTLATTAENRLSKAVGFNRQSRLMRVLPPISVCHSCDLPINPNGLCGCS